jgi:hypothetical protein
MVLNIVTQNRPETPKHFTIYKKKYIGDISFDSECCYINGSNTGQ